MIDTSKLQNIELDGINTRDYPDFCDAFIIYAEYDNGVELTEVELDELNDNYGEFIYESVINHLF